MSSVSLQEAQSSLKDLILKLSPGEEIVITENDQPVALLSVLRPDPVIARCPGTLRGTVVYLAPDFSTPLDDFAEYME